MLQIACPHCGTRDEAEFRYRGDAGVKRPDGGDAASFVEAVYMRDNPRGAHVEWWQHVHGCRRFVKVARDTFTHEITSATWPDGGAR